MSAIVQFPYSACRRVHSRKPRRSKNGTPEERAANAAAEHISKAEIIGLPLRQVTAANGNPKKDRDSVALGKVLKLILALSHDELVELDELLSR